MKNLKEAGCDLMLFDNVFQSAALAAARVVSCDLMLFDNVFQLKGIQK